MKSYPKEFVKEDVLNLCERYFEKEGYQPPTWFEHRCDMEYSERIYYSLVRDFQPVNVLEFGGSFGGSVCVNLAALSKNGKPFKYLVAEKFPEILEQCKANVTRFADINGYQYPSFVGLIEKNLDKVPDGIDYVFIDTNHDRENCEWYIKNIFPKLADGALVHIHDWAVREVDGELFWDRNEREQKEAGEISLLMELYKKKELPLKKLYWTWGDGVRTARGGFEEAASSFWVYKK